MYMMVFQSQLTVKGMVYCWGPSVVSSLESFTQSLPSLVLSRSSSTQISVEIVSVSVVI